MLLLIVAKLQMQKWLSQHLINVFIYTFVSTVFSNSPVRRDGMNGKGRLVPLQLGMDHVIDQTDQEHECAHWEEQKGPALATERIIQ